MNDFFVLDTNVLLSALLFESSKPTHAYKKPRLIGKICVSDSTLTEFSEVFLRKKFDKYFSRPKREILLKEFLTTIVIIKTKEHVAICRDPKDDKFLELAIAAIASCIITDDNDLLVLNPFRTIPILNPSDFLDTF